MKILIIETNINIVGGVERVTQTLANGFAREHQVDVLSFEQTGPKPFFKYDKRVGLHYIFEDSTNSTPARIMARKFLSDKLIRAGLEENKKLFEEADVIIMGRPHVAMTIFELYLDLVKDKKIIVRDSMNLTFFDQNARDSMLKYFPKYVDYFITSSDESVTAYENFFGADKVRCVKHYEPLGIEPSQADHTKFKTIMTTGRMADEQKGFDYVIKVMAKVVEKHPDWRCVINGDGPLKPFFEKVINDYQMNDYITLAGNCKDVAKAYTEAGIYLCCSRYEGHCNALVEAVACGLPTVTTDFLMGAEEIVTPDKTGIIVPQTDRVAYARCVDNEGDICRIAEAIDYLIENPKVREQYSKEAVKIIESRRADKIIQQYFDIIDEISA